MTQAMPRTLRRVRRAAMPEMVADLAVWLIGRVVLRVMADGSLAGGRIVETEAYSPDDAASHAFRGRTPRNGAMFGRAGTAYVYRAYGTSWMLNIAAGPVGVGTAVLIRALVPEIGLNAIGMARGAVALRDLARGPGRLAAALAIDSSLDGTDLCAPNPGVSGPLLLAEPRDAATLPPEALPVAAGPRIGITKAVERPYRFFVPPPHDLARFVSGPAWLNRSGVLIRTAPGPDGGV